MQPLVGLIMGSVSDWETLQLDVAGEDRKAGLFRRAELPP